MPPISANRFERIGNRPQAWIGDGGPLRKRRAATTALRGDGDRPRLAGGGGLDARGARWTLARGTAAEVWHQLVEKWERGGGRLADTGRRLLPVGDSRLSG